MVDRYTKVVLTVIALCLLWLCIKEPTVVAEARTKAKPSPKQASARLEPVEVRIANWDEAALWLSKSVQEVEGTVHVEGPVEVEGEVGVKEPVEVTGTVSQLWPIEVRAVR